MSEFSSHRPVKKKIVKLKRLKNAVLLLVALSVILLAISFTLLRVAIKSIPEYSLAIQQAVSKQIDMTLDVGFIDAEIYWLVPRLNLLDVNIYDNDGSHHLVHLDEVDLSLDWAESIRTMTPIVGEITLTGLNLQVGINKDSELLIQNRVVKENIDGALNSAAVSGAQSGFEISDTLKENFNNLNFKVLNSQIYIFDERNNSRSKTFSNLNLHLINSGSSHVFEVKADLPHKYGRYAHFIINVEGDLFDYKNLEGEAYLALENINFASWLDDYWNDLEIAANADINGRFWIAWSGVDILDVTSRVNISNIGLHYLDERVNTWSVNEIEAKVKWNKDDDDWQLDVRDLVVDREGVDWLKPAAATLRVLNSEKLVTLQADLLRVEGLAYLAGMFNSAADLDLPWLNLLAQFKPSGELRNLDVKLPLEKLDDIKVNTQFNQLGFSLPEMEPEEIKNLQGSVVYVDSNTWLILNSKNAEIKFNKLFRNSILLEKLQGKIKLSHKNKRWEMSSNSLAINTPDIQTEMRVNFNMTDAGKAFLDLTSRVKNGNAKAVSQYLPAGVMGKGAVAWIDSALHAGKIIDGGYLFYGNLTDAPFRGNEGVSLADFNVSGVDLRYLDNWPDVKNIAANLRFVNDTMLIKAHQGSIFDSKISNTTVYIDNFISPTLDVKGQVDVNLSDVKKFVDESTLREDVTDYIDHMKFNGRGDLNMQIFLPLYGDYKVEVGGRLEVNDGDLLFKKIKYELNHINGEIRFVGDKVESTGLTGQLTGSTAEQKLNINIATTEEDIERAYHVTLHGDLPAKSLLEPLPEMIPYIKGSSRWNADIDIINDKEEKTTRVSAQLNSDLQGVTTTLPGPLEKQFIEEAPIKLNIDVDGDKGISYKLVLQNKDAFDVRQTQDHVLMSVDAKSVKGKVDINTMKDVDVPIDIDLAYLNLSEFLKLEDSSYETDLHGDSVRELPEISPRDIPSLDIRVKKLIWKQAEYSESRLKIQESKLGVVIDEFKFTSVDHLVTGKGSWFTGKNNINTTKLDVGIKVDDLGNVFKELEISDSLFSTSGNINLRWSWQDAPYNFDWKKLQGDGWLSLEKGVLKNLDAGAGRLLGIFNFKTLLSLDFGSQVNEGFNFDKVRGTFSFSDENIYSDDFEIESKVATIFMKGKLSIANNSIDQTITVRPHLGGTVTLGTAVVAGPAVGGLVYLFQKIFNTDRLSEYQYTMKGAIDNPDVKLLSAPVLEEDEDSDF